jgi:hypothetical protein
MTKHLKECVGAVEHRVTLSLGDVIRDNLAYLIFITPTRTFDKPVSFSHSLPPTLPRGKPRQLCSVLCDGCDH